MILKRYSQTAALFSFESLHGAQDVNFETTGSAGAKGTEPRSAEGRDRSASRGERFS